MQDKKLIFCDRFDIRKSIIDDLSEKYISTSTQPLSLITQLNLLGTKCKELYGEDIRTPIDDSGDFYHGSNYRNWLDYFHFKESNTRTIITFDSSREMETLKNTIYNSFTGELIDVMCNKNAHKTFEAFIKEMIDDRHCNLLFVISTLSEFTHEFLGVHHNLYLWRSWLPSLIQTWESTQTDFDATMMGVWRDSKAKEIRKAKLRKLGDEDGNRDLRDTITTLLEENKSLEFDRGLELECSIEDCKAIELHSTQQNKAGEILITIIEDLRKANDLFQRGEYKFSKEIEDLEEDLEEEDLEEEDGNSIRDYDECKRYEDLETYEDYTGYEITEEEREEAEKKPRKEKEIDFLL